MLLTIGFMVDEVYCIGIGSGIGRGIGRGIGSGIGIGIGAGIALGRWDCHLFRLYKDSNQWK